MSTAECNGTDEAVEFLQETGECGEVKASLLKKNFYKYWNEHWNACSKLLMLVHHVDCLTACEALSKLDHARKCSAYLRGFNKRASTVQTRRIESTLGAKVDEHHKWHTRQGTQCEHPIVSFP